MLITSYMVTYQRGTPQANRHLARVQIDQDIISEYLRICLHQLRQSSNNNDTECCPIQGAKQSHQCKTRGHSGKGSLILLEYLEVVCAYLGVDGGTDVTERLPLGVAVFKSASLCWRWGQGEDNRGTKKNNKHLVLIIMIPQKFSINIYYNSQLLSVFSCTARLPMSAIQVCLASTTDTTKSTADLET